MPRRLYCQWNKTATRRIWEDANKKQEQQQEDGGEEGDEDEEKGDEQEEEVVEEEQQEGKRLPAATANGSCHPFFRSLEGGFWTKVGQCFGRSL